MKKIKCILSMILVCAMILPVSMLPVSAEDATTVDDVAYLYTEDFSCSDIADLGTEGLGWNQMARWELTTDGWLQSTMTGYNYLAVSEAADWSNYTFEADVVMTTTEISGNGSAGRFASIIVGADMNGKLTPSSKNGFELALTCRYTAGTDSANAKQQKYVFYNSGTSEYEYGHDFTLGDKINLKMEISGKIIKCYIDGELKYTYEGSSDIVGTIGLRAQGNVCKFDNIRVYNTSSTNFTKFTEDFSGTASDLKDKGWNYITNTNFTLADGKLQVAKYYNYLCTDEAMQWSNYTVEADVTVSSDEYTGTSGTRVAGIVAAATDTSKVSTGSGYAFYLVYKPTDSSKPNDGGKYIYQLWNRATGKGLVTETETWERGTEYNMKMVINGTNIKCYVNDILKIDYTVEDATSDLTGTIATHTSGISATFDNISVSPNFEANDYYDVSLYRAGRNNFVHPFKEGKVFAGWYEDAEYTTALSSATVTDKAYAKFVDENVLSVKAQLDATTLAASDTETTKMRFVTTVDNLDYQKVGFTVSTTKNSVTKTASFESTTAYKNIVAIDSNTAIDYEPRSFSNDSNYFVTIILKNLTITEADLTKVFTVTPYWVTADGTTVTGITRDADNEPITIDAGIRKNLGTQDSTQ